MSEHNINIITVEMGRFNFAFNDAEYETLEKCAEMLNGTVESLVELCLRAHLKDHVMNLASLLEQQLTKKKESEKQCQ